ncbi:MAG: nicotinate-nucleotide adenylyltransferase [Fimbriimonadales bacterium]|jgi:nicotinate-nucleotide adenylyltransferase|nr:nicotinate-nucleotide adenylyltransferase [Fimbriimonadales bacterium]GBC89891.1 Nicotinate-nucleotide adenylyltransferase [bacterium HR14]GIV14554.1 MAG: putative nicotinate-nucleotide adenylyltransferase [Fimbriimonadales bacterium]CUU05462.1 nicotinate-nucleotide adenylyltransferase [Armatimonadetes bacterium GBS]CUU33955.1 nicotinate-nucleotide adenylyltransferase [Armatimonadetes bacterium GXS]
MKRIGLFGGTFDPIHYGHLRLAEEAREFAQLDQVLFVPAARSPFRLEEPLTEAKHRLAMVRLAIASNPAFAVSEMEIQRGGISYTIETVEALQGEYSEAELFLILGADSLQGFPQWYQAERLAQKVTLLAGVRPPYDEKTVWHALPDWVRQRTLLVPMTPLAISASAIRQKVRAGHSIRYLTPDDVIEYIRENHLYTEPR